MNDDPTLPASSSAGTGWSVAAASAALAILPMALVGSLVVPYGRFILHALYGILENLTLRPFGFTPPAVVSFLIVNVALLATSLSAGRRLGALVTHYAVDRQVGSHTLVQAIPWIAGLAGAAAFASSVPWTTASDPTAPWPLHLLYATFGYLLHVAVLLLGPPRGASIYLQTHPYCWRCWAWMQRETGGGSFRCDDRPRVVAALTAGRPADLRDLPLATSDAQGPSCSLQWWQCPSCRDQGVVTCAAGDPASPPTHSQRIDARGLAEIRDLVSHRREIAPSALPRDRQDSSSRGGEKERIQPQ